MLNENAAKALGWTPEQAIGKIISKNFPGEVKGVIKDFHFASLHQPIGPLVIWLDTGMVRQMFVKINGAQIPKTLSAIEQVWKERVNHRPFTYHFMDEEFNKLYSTEEKTAKLFSLFSSIAIALACLGLFALAAFSTVQRNKEIGIRKVLGAGAMRIAFLLKEFWPWFLLAIAIAHPLPGGPHATGCRFRLPDTVIVVVICPSGLVAIVIAIGTISFHALKRP
jgi:putative ABC transport system permease protein